MEDGGGEGEFEGNLLRGGSSKVFLKMCYILRKCNMKMHYILRKSTMP